MKSKKGVTFSVYRACPMCKKEHFIEVDAFEYLEFEAGKFVQDAFPELSAAERELIKGGVCGECWNKMFGSPALGIEE